jgi:hypothetical protein
VNNISVEWHSGFFADSVKESILQKEKNIKDYMHKNSINLEDWY